MFQCVLVVNAVQYLITKDGIQNWKEITASLNRKDYDGVIRAFASKFEFVNDAYTLLHNEWQQKQLKASAVVIISRRNNSWTYNEKFRCALDFTSMDDDGHVFSISAKDESTENIIKANKSQTYDIQVSEIKEAQPLKYDHLTVINNIEWIPNKDLDEEHDTQDIYVYKYMSDGYGESYDNRIPLIVYGTPEISEENAIEYNYSTETSRDLVKFLKEKQVRIKAEFDVTCDNGETDLAIYMSTTGAGGGTSSDYKSFLIGTAKHGEVTHIDFDSGFFRVIPESYLQLTVTMIFHDSNEGVVTNNMTISNFKSVSLSFNFRSPKTVDIDVIKPVTLLNKLLNNMNGGSSLSGDIIKGHDARLDNALIVAAESIRGLKKAKIHTSFNKFTEWMKSEFGYIYIINGSNVTFTHRSTVFDSKVVKEIGSNFSDFKLTVNSGIIYSGIKVGYDKQDYDSINGRDEFRFTNSFSTNVNLTDNTLELISPYRADAYGIEFLTQKRGEDTTDSSSDNDVFFVGAQVSGNTYDLIRNGWNIQGVLDEGSMFNVMYSPRQMLLANKSMIAACTLNAEFTASEGNSDVTINGISEKAPLVLTEADRIFTSEEISIETPDTEFPLDWNGQVTITRNDATYYGYISSTKSNMAIEQSSNYKLIVAKTVPK